MGGIADAVPKPACSCVQCVSRSSTHAGLAWDIADQIIQVLGVPNLRLKQSALDICASKSQLYLVLSPEPAAMILCALGAVLMLMKYGTVGLLHDR